MKHRAPRTGPSLLLRLRRCGLAFLVAGVMPLHAAPPGELEAKIKAAYVFHIIKFVDWPNLPADTLHLCVAGSDGVTLLLGDLAGKQIKDRALKVDNDGSFDPSQCQVLYLGRPDRRWPELQANTTWTLREHVRDVSEVRIRGARAGRTSSYVIGSVTVRD